MVVQSVVAERKFQDSSCNFGGKNLVVDGENARLCGERKKIRWTIQQEGTTSNDTGKAFSLNQFTVNSFKEYTISTSFLSREGVVSFLHLLPFLWMAINPISHCPITVRILPHLQIQNKGLRFMDGKDEDNGAASCSSAMTAAMTSAMTSAGSIIALMRYPRSS